MNDPARVPDVGLVRALSCVIDDQHEDQVNRTSPEDDRAATGHAEGPRFKTRRVGPPLPGFARTGTRGAETAAGEGPAVGPVTTAGAERVDARAERRMLSVRVSSELYARYERILRELHGEGVDSSMTELVSALLFSGPLTSDDVRPVLREFRRRRDAGL